MGANTSRVRAAAAATAAVAVLLSALPAAGYHDGGPPPPMCDPMDDAASRASYHFARIRSVGYVMGDVDGLAVDDPVEGIADQLRLPNRRVQVFERADPGVARDIHVVGERIKLHYDGITNRETFLGDGLPQDEPRTTVKERLRANWDTDTRTFTGATRLDMVFTGRIQVWETETYTCHKNDTDDYEERTYEARKVLLEGFGTAATGLDDAQEDMGSAFDVGVGPGDTSER